MPKNLKINSINCWCYKAELFSECFGKKQSMLVSNCVFFANCLMRGDALKDFEFGMHIL